MARKPKAVDDVVAPAEDAPAPAEPVAPEPAVPKGQGKPLALGAAIGLIAAAFGYGAALQFPFGALQPAAHTDLAPIVARLEALEAAIGKVPDTDPQVLARLAALETAPMVDTETLAARLTQLERRIDAAPSDAEISAELAQIRDKLAQSDPAPAIKAAIAAEIGALQKSAQDIQAAANATAQKAAERAALTLLRAAMDTGGPYSAAAQDLTLPDSLATHAETGVPSLVALRDSFPAAARAGLQAALSQNMGATWGERVTNFLRSQTGARALTPQAGNDPDAVLSRIEAALRAADMPAVVAEIAQLPAPAQAAMADWVAQAKIRADALAALASLNDKGQ